MIKPKPLTDDMALRSIHDTIDDDIFKKHHILGAVAWLNREISKEANWNINMSKEAKAAFMICEMKIDEAFNIKE